MQIYPSVPTLVLPCTHTRCRCSMIQGWPWAATEVFAFGFQESTQFPSKEDFCVAIYLCLPVFWHTSPPHPCMSLSSVCCLVGMEHRNYKLHAHITWSWTMWSYIMVFLDSWWLRTHTRWRQLCDYVVFWTYSGTFLWTESNLVWKSLVKKWHLLFQAW